jgi:glycosyltransferase involved in cell wall biosynthesis
MKICFFNTVKDWGGGEKWHFEHALFFKETAQDVVVVSNKNSVLFKKSTVHQLPTKIVSIGNLSFLNPFKAFSIYSFFKKSKFDVLVVNLPADLKIAAPMAKLAGVPRIVYRRGSAIPIKNSFLNRFLFRNCLTDVLVNSEATKKSLLVNNKNLFPVEKIKVIYNGINVSKTVQSTENEIPVIGSLGRLVFQKGMDILLDIAQILKQKQVVCKIRIGGSGHLAEELHQKATQLNIMDSIEFVGQVDDPMLFMSQIDIFVLPSRWEGFGFVLAEAMLAKKPIVAFDVSSNPELISNNENGFLIPFDDKEAFAEAIRELIEQPEKRKKMGEKGYAFALQKFNFEINKLLVLKYLSEKQH